MKIILLILLIIYFIYYYKETFSNIDGYNNNISIYAPIYKNNKCCLVKKKIKDAEWIYHYKKLSGTKCNIDNNLSNNNQNLFIVGQSDWKSNKYCSNTKNKEPIIGSCRNINFECKDFITKKECDKFKMRWSDVPCHQPIKFPMRLSTYKNEV